MNNHHRATPVFVGLLAALAALGYLTFSRNGASMPGMAGKDVAARSERDRQAQYDALDAKVDRLAYLMQSIPSGARTPNSGTAAQVGDPRPERMTPQQAQARQMQIKADLDERFETQPADAHWSLESTRVIERSLTAENLEGIGAHPPTASRIDCRSGMCRIHLVYGDSGSAGDAGMMLNMAIAERMPYTQVLSQTRSDGGVDYFIYATRERPAPRRQ